MIEFILCEFNGIAFHAGGLLCLLESGHELIRRESGLLESGNAHFDEGFLNPVAEMVVSGIRLVEDEDGGFIIFFDCGMIGLAFVECLKIRLYGGGKEGGANFTVSGSEATSKRASKSMNGAESDVGQGDAAKKSGIRHCGASD